MHRLFGQVALAWFMLAPGAVRGETVILQLHVLEGDGGVFAASARALKPVTVRVTNETGAPIEGAAVSFRLPEEGVTGIFQNGLKTDLVLSAPDGRAVSPGISWGPLAGPAKLRVTAALDEARAGVLVPVYVSPGNVAVAGASSAAMPAAAMEPIRVGPGEIPKLKGNRPWVKWVVIAAAGIGAGAALGLSRQSGGSGGAVSVTGAPPISIGQPTISVGRIP